MRELYKRRSYRDILIQSNWTSKLLPIFKLQRKRLYINISIQLFYLGCHQYVFGFQDMMKCW